MVVGCGKAAAQVSMSKSDAQKPGQPVSDDSGANQLVAVVYDELHRLARKRMASEPPGHTLQATALVHEAYLRLLRQSEARWEHRGQFYVAAAEAMHRILIERARRKRARKHGGGLQRITLGDMAVLSDDDSTDMAAVDDALERLKRRDPRKHAVVMLRFFAGLTVEEAAESLGMSPATVKNDWNYAKAWLHRELSRADARFGEDGRPDVTDPGVGT